VWARARAHAPVRARVRVLSTIEGRLRATKRVDLYNLVKAI